MKHLMLEEPLTEREIHPPATFDHFQRHSVASAWEARATWPTVSLLRCPACDGQSLQAAFERLGYPYLLCESCRSLWASPRPNAAATRWYLHDSQSARFRRSSDYQQAMAARQAEVAQYRVDWLLTLLARTRTVGPIGVFQARSEHLLHLLSRESKHPVFAIDPVLGQESLQTFQGQWRAALADIPSDSLAALTLFDALELAADPQSLMQEARRVLQPGGWLLITTRAGSGFDIQVLWEHAGIFPMEHLNLFSVEGLSALLKMAELEAAEISTPGLLDLPMIQRIARDDPQVQLPRFLDYLLQREDEAVVQQFQAFLQKALLSSHLRAAARCPFPTPGRSESARCSSDAEHTGTEGPSDLCESRL